MRRAADDLAAVVPPEDVRVEHAALVESMRALADEIGVLAKRRDLGYVTRFEALLETNAFADGNAAAEALRRKGYRVPT